MSQSFYQHEYNRTAGQSLQRAMNALPQFLEDALKVIINLGKEVFTQFFGR